MKLVLSCRISLASVIERTLRVEDLFQVHFSDVWMGVRGKQFVAKRTGTSRNRDGYDSNKCRFS
jgi:hypothetical protein